MFVSNGVLTKTPIMPGNSSWFSHMPPMSSPLLWAPHYSQLFRSQLWVNVVIMKRARALARLPIPVYQRDSDGGRTKLRDHPMARLLANPNPAMSGFKLFQWTSATRDVFGTAVWYKMRKGGEVAQLWPLPPNGLTPNDDGTYSFSYGTMRLERIKSTDLVFFTSYDPDSPACSMSPMEPLRSTLENEYAARTATNSFWTRGARPGFVVEHPKQLSIPAYERLREAFADNHEGPGKVGRTLILEEGMKAAKMELTAEEAQYIETRKLNREEVCAAYDVPPPVVHILDNATFSNITEQMRSMYRDTMAPIAADFEGVIETDLRAVEFGNEDIYAEFLMDDVMRGDFETRQTALNQASHMTIAEKRAVENLPFIEGTDRIFLNTATMPLDAIDAQAAAIVAGTPTTPPEPPAVMPEQTPAQLSAKALRAILGRLGWQSSLDQVDADALCKGFDTETAETIRRALAGAADIPGLKAALKEES